MECAQIIKFGIQINVNANVNLYKFVHGLKNGIHSYASVLDALKSIVIGLMFGILLNVIVFVNNKNNAIGLLSGIKISVIVFARSKIVFGQKFGINKNANVLLKI